MAKKVELHELVVEYKKLADELGRQPTLQEFKTVASYRQVMKFKFNTIVEAAGFTPRIFNEKLTELEVRPARILFLDIETSAILAMVWGTFNQNVGLNQIVKDWHMMSYGASFSDEEKIHYLDQRYCQDYSDDRQLIEGIHYLIQQADYICAHNLDFDWGKLNAKFIHYNLEPVHPQFICTLKMARKLMKRGITSKKLEFLAKWLGVTPKEQHKEFHGMELWSECLNGNMKAWDEMEIYNRGDVITLKEVFYRLVRYDTSINFSTFMHKNVCTCGSTTFFKDGFRVLKSGKYQVWKCQSCSKYFRSKHNELSARIKLGLFS
jgi:uncharacterized protein YprB with RNaseH-like and TPR domain